MTAEKEGFEMKITTTHIITDQDIDDLMVTALEGGITGWCGKARIIKFPDWMEEEDKRLVLASDIISRGGEIKLFDKESSDTWLLNKDMVLAGIKLYCEEFDETPTNVLENLDADSADSIIQLAIFKELTFS